MNKVLCQSVDGVCSQCGKAVPPGLFRRCGREDRPPKTPHLASRDVRIEAHGLGNLVESALEEVGITKNRWIAFKQKMGLPATCGCSRRKEYLNKLGAELGDKAKGAVSRLLGFGESDKTDNSIEEN